MFCRILVWVDGSTESTLALGRAIALADAEHARLTILTAVVRPPCWALTAATAAGIGPLVAELTEEARTALGTAVRSVPPKTPVTTILSEESEACALRAELRRGGHDLLVLGVRRHGRVGARLSGWRRRWRLRGSEAIVVLVGEAAVASGSLGRGRSAVRVGAHADPIGTLGGS